MKKYKVNLTNIEKLQTLEIEAESMAQAVEKAKEKFENGECYVYENEVKADGVHRIGRDI